MTHATLTPVQLEKSLENHSADFLANPAAPAALPPAVTIPLAGQYIIEASAGTGKTWTLTGILLRLLIERGVPCEKIIATTFTRAAAVEMRERVHARLMDMMKVLKLCERAMQPRGNATSAGIFEQGVTPISSEEKYPQFLQQVLSLAEKENILEKVQGDALHWHLVTWIAQQMFDMPIQSLAQKVSENDNQNSLSNDLETLLSQTSQNSKNPNSIKSIDFRIAIQRTTIALSQLDRLFVGTLDSLCQKWLREFSAETGYAPNIQVNTQPDSMIMDLVHDQNRAFRAWLAEQEPAIFEIMLQHRLLPSPSAYLPAIHKALTFYSTPIDSLTVEPIDMGQIEQTLQDFIRLTASLSNAMQAEDAPEVQAFMRYLDPDYRGEQGFSGGLTLHKRFGNYGELQRLLHEQRLSGLVALAEPSLGWLKSIADCIEQGTGFKKKFENQRDTFVQNAVVQLLYRLYQAKIAIDTHITQINQFFVQYISRYVKEQLPLVLENRGQTTFSLQLARLNDALIGQQGKVLARYIRHQYPVMLVDESQDINTEQAMLIQSVYLQSPTSPNNASNHATTANDNLTENAATANSQKTAKKDFLLLVGDPKQAIYGFRGGDVSNYTALKNQFSTSPLALTQNFRSSQAIITALNHWFGVPDTKSDAALFTQAAVNPPTQDTEQNANQSPSQSTNQKTMPLASEPYVLGEQIYYRYITAARTDSNLIQLNTNDATTLPEKEQNFLENNASCDNTKGVGVYLLTLPLKETTKEIIKEATEPKKPQADTKSNPEKKTKPLAYAEVIVAQILALLAPENAYRYYKEQDAKLVPLKLDQFCVLANTNRELDKVEKALHQKGIPTMRGGTQSVFSGQMTQELIVLMQAMLYPYDITRIRRLLMGCFFNLSLDEVTQLFEADLAKALESNLSVNGNTSQPVWAENQFSLNLTLLTEMLNEAGKQWGTHGFLSAVQWLFNQQFARDDNLATAQSFWQHLAALPEGERLLIDLRQLLDIISQFAKTYGEHQLLHWFELLASEQPKEEWSMQQRLPSEDGVYLMTIHQSKGLEFDIVFVVGLDNVVGLDKKGKNEASSNNLYLYIPHPANAVSQLDYSALQNRRLSPITRQGEQDFVKEAEQANYAEKLRLAYVAFTRAKERLYIVAQASTRKETSVALNQWLADKTFDLPETLAGIIPTVDINSLSKYLNKNYHYIPIKELDEEDPKEDLDERTQPGDYDQWIAAITETEFFGWSNTSFTALSRQLAHDKQNVAINQPDYDDFEQSIMEDEVENVLFIANDTSQNALQNVAQNATDSRKDTELKLLRFGFQKGTNTGIFLHKILELLPSETLLNENPVNEAAVIEEGFINRPWYDESRYISPDILTYANPQGQIFIGGNEANVGVNSGINGAVADVAGDISLADIDTPPIAWQSVINRAVDNYQIGNQYRTYPKQAGTSAQQQQEWLSLDYMALAAWLYNVINTPLAASGRTLSSLSPNQKIHELGFNMSLRRDFSIPMLNKLFAIEGVKMVLDTKRSLSHYWRYLRGEIDLVYQDDDKFFVVDYKSNFLGDSFEDYHQDALNEAMNQHGYWLQAAIYQVALHRYLQLRLPNYNIHKHLGAVEYVFLRGMHPDKPEYGKLSWQPSAEFILTLDKAFGRAEM